MNEFMYNVGSALVFILILGMGFMCLYKGFDRKFSMEGTFFLWGILMIAVAAVIILMPKGFLLWAPFCALIVFAVTAYGMMGERRRKGPGRFVSVMMLTVMVMLLEWITAMSYLLYDPAYILSGLTAESKFFLTVSWAILMIGFYKSIREKIAQPRMPGKIRFYQNIFLITVSFLEVFLVSYVVIDVLHDGAVRKEMIAVAMGALLAFDISFVIFIQRMARSRLLQKQVELEAQQMHLEEQYYATIEHQYKNSLDMIQRMAAHIQNLKDYYENGEPQEAHRYAEQTLKEISDTGMSFGCRNKTLAVIFEDKRLLCQEKGIRLTVEDKSSGLSFMDIFDITTIFSNLLDNAIQALEKVEEPEIHVSLFERREMLGICIENPYAGTLNRRGGEFLTTKIGGVHGIGLKNVAAAVKKYHGEMDILTERQLFRVQILIPLEK